MIPSRGPMPPNSQQFIPQPGHPPGSHPHGMPNQPGPMVNMGPVNGIPGNPGMGIGPAGMVGPQRLSFPPHAQPGAYVQPRGSAMGGPQMMQRSPMPFGQQPHPGMMTPVMNGGQQQTIRRVQSQPVMAQQGMPPQGMVQHPHQHQPPHPQSMPIHLQPRPGPPPGHIGPMPPDMARMRQQQQLAEAQRNANTIQRAPSAPNSFQQPPPNRINSPSPGGPPRQQPQLSGWHPNQQPQQAMVPGMPPPQMSQTSPPPPFMNQRPQSVQLHPQLTGGHPSQGQGHPPIPPPPQQQGGPPNQQTRLPMQHPPNSMMMQQHPHPSMQQHQTPPPMSQQPPRPPSQPQPQLHHPSSSSSSSSMMMPPPGPPPPRPHSRPASRGTPNMQHAQLPQPGPASAPSPSIRRPAQQPPMKPPTPSHSVKNEDAPTPPRTARTPSSQHSPPQPQPPPPMFMNASGPAPPPEGKGLSRFLSFTSHLCRETPHKFQLQWWRSVVHEHFAPSASMRMTLWKDNQSQEAKSFDVSAAILPRFFLVTSQSGVHSMSITLDGATERVESLVNNVQAIVIECQDSSWIFRYTNGYVVTLRGSLLVRMLLNKKEDNHDSMDEFGPGMDGRRPSLGGDAANLMGKKDVDWMFDQVIFDARGHEKYVSLASIRGIVGSTGSGSEGASSPGAGAMLGLEGPGTMANGVGGMVNGFGGGAGTGADDPHIVIENGSIPGEPVNAFGIPQPTMRCLELAESVAAMADLIAYSQNTEAGPLDALRDYARTLREQLSGGPGGPGPGPMPMPPQQHHMFGPPQPHPNTHLGPPSAHAGPSSHHMHPPPGHPMHPMNMGMQGMPFNHGPPPGHLGPGPGMSSMPPNSMGGPQPPQHGGMMNGAGGPGPGPGGMMNGAGGYGVSPYMNMGAPGFMGSPHSQHSQPPGAGPHQQQRTPTQGGFPPNIQGGNPNPTPNPGTSNPNPVVGIGTPNAPSPSNAPTPESTTAATTPGGGGNALKRKLGATQQEEKRLTRRKKG